MRLVLAPLVLAAACFPTMPQPVQAVDTQSPQFQAQQRAAFAQSMGYPTKKSPAELDATIAKQTKDFKPAGKHVEGRLETPAPLTIDARKGTCYTIVMKLGDDAAWGTGAEAGLKFDFQGASGNGSGGPGVVGPGAVASVGCAEADGSITWTMAPMVGHDPIGQGTYWLDLYSHALTAAEAKHLEEDKQRQIAEQQDFQRREEAKKQQRLSSGCAKCDARYQGCIGAGRGQPTCQSDYRSCAFEEAGPDYLSACPSAR
jgi:hypothetical protein